MRAIDTACDSGRCGWNLCFYMEYLIFFLPSGKPSLYLTHSRRRVLSLMHPTLYTITPESTWLRARSLDSNKYILTPQMGWIGGGAGGALQLLNKTCDEDSLAFIQPPSPRLNADDCWMRVNVVCVEGGGEGVGVGIYRRDTNKCDLSLSFSRRPRAELVESIGTRKWAFDGGELFALCWKPQIQYIVRVNSYING